MSTVLEERVKILNYFDTDGLPWEELHKEPFVIQTRDSIQLTNVMLVVTVTSVTQSKKQYSQHRIQVPKLTIPRDSELIFVPLHSIPGCHGIVLDPIGVPPIKPQYSNQHLIVDTRSTKGRQLIKRLMVLTPALPFTQ